jgi:acyl dehydratase
MTEHQVSGPMGLYYEEFEIGWSMRTAGRTVREYDVSTFVSLAGFVEPLFLDDRQANLGGDGRRVAPGALTLSLAEGLVMQTNTLHHTAVAFLGADVEVMAPVFVGDSIEVQVEVVERRLTSKGDRGLVRTENRVVRDGEEVLRYRPLRMIRCADGS